MSDSEEDIFLTQSSYCNGSINSRNDLENLLEDYQNAQFSIEDATEGLFSFNQADNTLVPEVLFFERRIREPANFERRSRDSEPQRAEEKIRLASFLQLLCGLFSLDNSKTDLWSQGRRISMKKSQSAALTRRLKQMRRKRRRGISST